MAADTRVILDDDDPPPRQAEARESSRFGFEWGLASTLIGATFLIMGPVAFLFCLSFWVNGKNDDHGLSLRDLQLIEIGSIVCVIGAEALCVVSVFFGIRGLAHARRERRPVALPLSGILLSAVAMGVWLIVAIDLLMMVATFIRWKGY